MNVVYFLEGIICGTLACVVCVIVLIIKLELSFDSLECMKMLNNTKSG